MDIKIIYEDEYIIAINKPPGMIVHRTDTSPEDEIVALSLVRKYLKNRIFPIHRIDKKTSGVLIFGKTSKMAHLIHTQIIDKKVQKVYWAIVNNYSPPSATATQELTNSKGKIQSAETVFTTFNQIKIPDETGAITAMSFLQAEPKTGRMHQIRKHCNLEGFPIIGDPMYGYHRANKYFVKKFGIKDMFLHSRSYTFHHPALDEEITIEADLNESFQTALDVLKPYFAKEP